MLFGAAKIWQREIDLQIFFDESQKSFDFRIAIKDKGGKKFF